MDTIEYGPLHPDHFRVSWPPHWQSQIEISIPSCLSKHLACNDSLPSNDDAHARTFRETLAAGIAQDQAKLAQLRQEMADLETRLERTKKAAFACDVLCSPFRRIPSEIVYAISAHLRPDSDHPPLWDWDPTTDSAPTPGHHPPSAAAQTCRLWRRVVHDIPQLWQVVHLDCTPWTAQNIHVLKSRVQRFAQLATPALPLAIHLDESSRRPLYDINTHGHALRKVLDWFFTTTISSSSIDTSSRSIIRIHKLSIRPYDIQALLRIFTYYANRGAALASITTLMLREIETTADGDAHDVSTDEITAIARVFPEMRRFWFGQQRDVNALPARAFSVVNHGQVAHLSALTHLFLQPIIGLKTWGVVLQLCTHLRTAWFELDDDEDPDGAGIVRGRPLSGSVVRSHAHLEELVLSLRQFEVPALHILQPFVSMRFPKLATMRLHFDAATRLAPYEPDRTRVAIHLLPERFTHTFAALRVLVVTRDGDAHEEGEGNSVFEFDYTGLYPLFFAAVSLTSLSLFPRRIRPFVAILEFIVSGPDHLLPSLRTLNMGLSLSDVRDTVDAVVQLITHALLGGSVETYCAILGDDDAAAAASPPTVTCAAKARRARLASMAVRCRMVGVPRLLAYTIPSRMSYGRVVYIPTMQALAGRLCDECEADVGFEVDMGSEDGLVSAVPFGMAPEEWFIRRF